MIQFFSEELGDLAWQRGSKFFVCLSSRHYPHLEIPVSLRLILEHQEGHSADVEKYVRTKLRAGSGSMQQDLTAQILRKASGVFLWAVLVVEILNKEIRSGRLFAMTRRLNELPGDLSALFKSILDKDRDNLDNLLLGIQWILFAARPLTEKEFYYALASGLDPDFKDVRWDPDYITLDHMERLVHSSTKGLAELTRADEDDDHKDDGLEGGTPEEEEEDDDYDDDDDDDYDDDYDDDNDDDYDNDKDMRFVQFIHESVRDFLLKDGGIGDLLPGSATLSTFAPFSHDRLKKCCDAYITASGVDLEKAKRSATSYVDYENFRRDLEENFPFMSYAVQYRFHHCNKAAETIPQIEYLSQFDIRPRIAAGTDSSAQCLPHFAAEYDYANILKELQGTSSLYINVQDCDGWTALLLAVQHGSIDTVKVLLSTPGVDVNQQNYRGLSPLAIAVLKGHVAILQILLAMPNINVNLPGKRGQTPLFWATREKVLSPLLDHPNIDINVTDDKGQTFLHQFIERGLGSKRLVEMVLQRRDFNTSILSVEDKGGDTPLSLAMRTQSYETVALVRAKTI
jgi:ankyrin repeat protein